MEGRKDDAGKPALDLIPWDVIIQVARDDMRTSLLGSEEYGERLAIWWRTGDELALRELFLSICDDFCNCAPDTADDVAGACAKACKTVYPVLAYGAAKYAAWNWAKGMKWSRVYAAALRHWMAWIGGQDLDPETGLEHRQHLACCILFLMVYEMEGVGEDDRPDYKPALAA